MFPSRYFADRYFAPRYWCKTGFGVGGGIVDQEEVSFDLYINRGRSIEQNINQARKTNLYINQKRSFDLER
jgi:hypothetical protein